MPYLAVADFKYGMDRRRPQQVGIPGTLWVLKNAVVSRGGDIERCKKWVKTHTLPVNPSSPFNRTQGLEVRNNLLTTFAYPNFTADFPYDVNVQTLQHPDGPPNVLTRAIAKTFDNKLYAIAEFSDGNVYHYYNATTAIAAWTNTLAPSLVSKNSLAHRVANVVGRNPDVEVTAQDDRVVVKAKTAGTPFTLMLASTGGTVPTKATTTITFTAVTGATSVTRLRAVYNGTPIELIQFPYPGGGITAANTTAMATAVAAAINAYSGSSGGWSASSAGAVVTVSAPIGGTLYNGTSVAINITNGTVSAISNMSGGTDSTATGKMAITAVQPNVVAVAETRAAGTITITGGSPGGTITGVTINAVQLLSAPVAWLTDAATTANALVVAINNAALTTYQASAVGAVVTLRAAAGTGTTVNGHVVLVTSSGITTNKTNVAGGVAAVAAQKQISTLTVTAVGSTGPWMTFTVTVNGTPYVINTLSAGMGTSIFVQKNRVWSTAVSTVQYCKLNDPSNWSDANASSGSGFINVSTVADGAQYLYGMEDYQGQAAIFAENAILLYSIFADAQQIAIQKPIKNTGTRSIGSVRAYGADDVFYLDKTGVRSVRSRDGYDAAFASDIGSSIDPFVRETMMNATWSDVVDAKSVVETDDGRYMLAIGSTIIVLSYFPASKITAWSYIDFGLPIENMVRCGDRVILRTGNDLYTYGGEDGTTYPDDGEYVVTVETPFMTASDPATFKQLEAYDHIATGEWKVEVLVDPNNKDNIIQAGRLVGTTNNDLAARLIGRTTHFALRYTCDKGGFASISANAIHFEKDEQS